MGKPQVFLDLLHGFIDTSLLFSNNELEFCKNICTYFNQLFNKYRLFIAHEYNFSYTLFYEKELLENETGINNISRIPYLSHKFVSDNLKKKSPETYKEFYISTILYKSLNKKPVYRIDNISGDDCPIAYEYLLCIKSKNTLLGILNFDSLLQVFDRFSCDKQLKVLQSSLSNAFETYHLYKDFDIKINEFMKLKDSTEMIIESIDLGIIVLEHHNKLRAINKKAIKMLDIERSITDKELTELIKNRFNDNILEIIKYNLKTSESSIKLFDKEYRTDDITRRVDMVICPYKDISNKPTGFIIILDDITERKKYEEKLLRQERLASLGQVIAGVAHEINTPLTGIRSYSQLLKESISNKDLFESSELVEKIIKQVDRCSTIIDELLSFARKKKANKTYFSINKLICDVISITDTIIKGKDIQIEVRPEDRDNVIFGDRGKLEQVFLNLILNSKDAIIEKGRIEIDILDKGQLIDIIIKDNGKGIPDEDLPRIFDPFFTTKRTSGTGLGLSLSYGVIKDHNGDIKVKSMPNQGSEFIITLPKS